jgi:hypothetical protein
MGMPAIDRRPGKSNGRGLTGSSIEALFFFRSGKEGQAFDRLRPNG